MHWKTALIPPLAIYATVFMFISALIGFKIDQNAPWVWVVGVGITIGGLIIALRYARPTTVKRGLLLGFVWLALFIALDMALTTPFTGWGYFLDWKSYIPYILTIAIPALWPTFSKRSA
mgnify:CR=1 FL=1